MASWQAVGYRLCGALVWGVLAAPVHAQVAPVLSLAATPAPAVQGSTVAVDVLISGIADLYAWQFSLSFNPSVLQAASVTEGTFLEAGGTTFFGGGTIDNSAGTVGFAFNTLQGAVPGVSGSGVLARLNFGVTGVGNSPLALSDVLFLDSNDAAIPLTIQGLTVTAVPVPEPASLLLFGAGLAALGWARRQRAG